MTPRTSSAAIQNSRPQPDGRGDHTNLSHHYGNIGIQAVAAAARYSDRCKSPVHETVHETAHASAPGLRIDLRFVESAS
jgi:hypothetical protein